jgi:Ca2+-binding RTX toxin-like protein
MSKARTTRSRIPSTINMFWVVAISLIMLLSIVILPIKGVLSATDTGNDNMKNDAPAANGDFNGNSNSNMVLPIKGVSADNAGNNNDDDDNGNNDGPKTHSGGGGGKHNTNSGDPKLGNIAATACGDILRMSGHIIYGSCEDDIITGSSETDKINGIIGNDKLSGRDGGDIIQGGIGSDKLFGEDGDDFLLGGLGDDLLVGGNGNDKLLGGLEDDTLIGGPGKDYFNCGEGQDVIVDFNSAQGDTRTQDCEVINS